MPLLTLNLSCENVKYPARKHFEKTNTIARSPFMGDIMVWSTLFYAQYGAQNHNALTVWGRDIMVGCSTSINERILVY